MRMSLKPVAAALVLSLAPALAGCGFLGGAGDEPGDIQVYSARHYDLENAFAQFEEDTGLTVDFLFADDADLRQRLQAEGAGSPADVFISVDAGNLWAAQQAGLLEPVDSEVLADAVPRAYRDAEGHWFGLALRARTLAYNPDRVDPAEFDTENSYAGLADPKWRGRLCMRDATGTYTQSLVAALLEVYGREETEEILRGWLANDVDIMTNDVLQIEAIDAGTCDVGLINHYYLARELEDDPDLDVDLFWASQDGEGVQMNLSGGGVVATSDNKEGALQLLEWLATDGQRAFVGNNHEFPVNPDVAPDESAAQFGPFDPMPVDAAAYGRRNAEAVDLLEEVGYE
jgi:iron(III) transport system substrate-binding protein